MVSAIVMTLSDETTGGRIARLSGRQCQPLDRQEFREEMVAFIVGAIEGGRST